MVVYREDISERLWWCNSHQRKATHTVTYNDGRVKNCCNPSLGGIMLPCNCVDLTDDLEISVVNK